jgi:hypothetical protein
MRARRLALCFAVSPVLLLAACAQTQQSTGTSDTHRSVDGYWLATEQDDQDTLRESSFVEYWYMRTVASAGSAVRFEVTDACDTSLVLATGELSAEGDLSLLDDSGAYVRTFAQFTDDNVFEGTDGDNGARLVAQRIEPPDCAAFPDADGVGVQAQPLNYVVEDDENLVTLAASTTNGGTPVLGAAAADSSPNGLDHLEAARGAKLPLGDDYDKPNGMATSHCADSSGNAVDCPADPNEGHAGLVRCSVQNYSESKQKSLVDVVALSDEDEIYPGALLQGGSLASGDITPITIPRAAGTLTLRGLTVSGASYSTTVDSVTLANVTDAVAGLLQDNQILGTVADASLDHHQVYSAQDFDLRFGVDVSAADLPASISGQLNVDTTSTDNLVVLQFTQVYYTVSFQTPEHSWSVFRDDKGFDDPDGQIGNDNPPLYVKNVKYGRQIFLFFRSSYGARLVEAALDGAASAQAANVKVSGNLTYKDVMADTRVTYVVRGGDAGLALDPVKNAKPEDLYTAILGLIANRDAADFSVSNPGIPVAYELRYLIGDEGAKISYTIAYDKCDCQTYPPADHDYTLRISHPLQSAWVYLDDTKSPIAGPYQSANAPFELRLNDFLTDEEAHTLIVQLYARCLWESASASWDLYVDGSRRWHDSVSKSPLATCQIHNVIGGITTLFANEVYEARIRISRRTGEAQVLGLSK